MKMYCVSCEQADLSYIVVANDNASAKKAVMDLYHRLSFHSTTTSNSLNRLRQLSVEKGKSAHVFLRAEEIPQLTNEVFSLCEFEEPVTS